MGLILSIFVAPANEPERSGGQKLLSKALGWLWWARLIWVDQGYNGPEFAKWVRSQKPKLEVEVVEKEPNQKGFAVQKRRWVVERTFGWLMKHRRLVRNYEAKTRNAESFAYVAMIGVMLRRLA